MTSMKSKTHYVVTEMSLDGRKRVITGKGSKRTVCAEGTV